jgi:hypothetical protein
MSDNDSDIQEMANEGTPASRQDTSPDAFYPADALAMFTRQLDNALQKQKQELCLEIDAKRRQVKCLVEKRACLR